MKCVFNYSVARHEEDYWTLREFVRELFGLNGRREISWQVSRFDYFYWHILPNCCELKLDDTTFFWKNEKNEIVSLLINEDKICHLNLHPNFQIKSLLNEMLDVVENQCFFKSVDGKTKTAVEVDDGNQLLISILNERGYVRSDIYSESRIRRLDSPIPEAKPIFDFVIRNMNGKEDHASRSLASWDAFHHNDDAEFHGDLEWYALIEKMPLYRAQLDVVAEAKSEHKLIGFCTVLYDDVNRTAYFEPVGLNYDYHRKGLGKAMVMEGLRRVKNMGCELAFVSSQSENAAKLYESCGFITDLVSHVWLKEIV